MNGQICKCGHPKRKHDENSTNFTGCLVYDDVKETECSCSKFRPKEGNQQ